MNAPLPSLTALTAPDYRVRFSGLDALVRGVSYAYSSGRHVENECSAHCFLPQRKLTAAAPDIATTATTFPGSVAGVVDLALRLLGQRRPCSRRFRINLGGREGGLNFDEEVEGLMKLRCSPRRAKTCRFEHKHGCFGSRFSACRHEALRHRMAPPGQSPRFVAFEPPSGRSGGPRG